jgi:hypothetical protein
LHALIISGSAAAIAEAADYATDEVNAQAKRHSGLVLSVIRNPARYAAEKAKVQEYFTGYYFPAMTQTAPEDLAILGNLRYDLFRKYLWATDHEALQRDLTEIALNATKRIVGASRPPYHPAVRYNAVLVLGQLDQQYAVEGAAARPPVPLPAATELLVKVVAAAADDKPVPPPVVLGAVIGLERHARFREALAPGAADAMTKALLKLATREKPIQEMDRETYDWLRLRTAGVLAQLGSIGPKNEVLNAIFKLAADLRSLDDRVVAAAMLDKFKFEGVKLDSKTTLEPLLDLAHDLGEAESKRAEEFQDAQLGGRGYGPGREFMSSGSTTRETFPRRHVLARLIDLRNALRAVMPAMDEKSQAKLDSLVKILEPGIKAAQDKETAQLTLAGTIHKMASALESEAAPADELAADSKEDVF